METDYKLTDHRSPLRLALTLLATLSLLATHLIAFSWADVAGADELEVVETDLDAVDCVAEPEHEDCVEEDPGGDVPETTDCDADPTHEDCVVEAPEAVDCDADPAHEDCVVEEPEVEEPAAVDCEVDQDDPSCADEEMDGELMGLEDADASVAIEPLASDSCAGGGGNPGDSLDQWANGKPGTDPAGGKWQNGNLNANNSQYKEGDSVGFRRILTGLQENCRYRVFINYDTVNNGLVAYDYLTSWDRTPSVAVANPTEGVSGVAGGEERVAIDPGLYTRVTNAGLGLAGPREFSVYGANWNHGDDGAFLDSYSDGGGPSTPWPGKTETDRSSNATVTTTVRIEFTAESSNVVLAWGGHIAVKGEWAPKLTAPRETNGSPYHMRNTRDIRKLTEPVVAWNAGNQDRSLKAGAVLVPGLSFTKRIAGDDLELIDVGEEPEVNLVPVFEPGDTYTYELVITNSGGDSVDATDVTVTDTFHSGLEIDDSSLPAGCSITGQDLECTGLTIPANSDLVISVPVTVPADGSVCGLVTNDAEMSSTFQDVVPATVDVFIDCRVDVSIDKSVEVPEEEEDGWRALGGEETLEPGDAFRYVLTVTHSGNIPAVDVTVDDADLADLLDVFDTDGDITIDDEGERNCTLDGTNGLDCDLGNLAVNEIVTITIPLQVTDDLTADQCGPNNTYTNTATVYLDGEHADDDDAEIELACETDVGFDKQLAEGSPSSLPLAGGSTTYELTATNDGSARATGVVIRDNVPDVFEIDMEAFDVANAGIECEIDGNEVVCGPVSIVAGGSVTIEIPVSLASDLPLSACGVVTNAGELYEGLTDLAEVDFDELAPDHTDSVNVNIVCPPPAPDTPQITLDKTANPTSIVLLEGEDPTAVVTYTYTALNSGDVTLDDVTLTDDVLGDLTDELRDALGKSSLSVGESVTFSVDQTVGVDDVGLLVNIAIVSGTGGGSTVTDTATATVEITQVLGQVFEPSIDIVKEALIEADGDGLKTVTVSADGSADITYRYTITNTGDTMLTGITLVDDVIGDLTDLLDVTMLEPGQSTVVEVTYASTAADLAAGRVDNVGLTTGTSPQGATVDASDEESVGIVEVLAEVQERPVAEQLPRTGVNTTMLIGLALVLAALGYAALLLGARRRRGHPL